MTYPLALYRAGDGKGSFKWDGRMTRMCAVLDAAEHEAALAEGWQEAAAYLGPAPLSLLDSNAKEITAVLPELTIEELEALRTDETAGKARKGVLAAIDDAIDAKLEG